MFNLGVPSASSRDRRRPVGNSRRGITTGGPSALGRQKRPYSGAIRERRHDVSIRISGMAGGWHLDFEPRAKTSMTIMRQLGKITREELVDAEVNDMRPRYRFACQCFIRDEDIVVSFEGDRTLPAKKATLPPIKSVEDFYAYAAKVEEDAAIHYEELAAVMKDVGNKDVADFFLELADYSRTHLSEVKAHAGTIDPNIHLPAHFTWPHHFTPQHTDVWAGEPALARLDALKAGLQGEKRGYEYYYIVADSSGIPEVAKKAKEFLKEEAEHIALLERWICTGDARQNPGAA